jgi:hypothetical protein
MQLHKCVLKQRPIQLQTTHEKESYLLYFFEEPGKKK